MSKHTYTPTIEELSRQYGGRYFTVTTRETGHPSASALQYGTIEDIVSTADATIYSAYGDTADLDRYSLRISYGARALVYIPRVGDGPDSARIAPQPAGTTYEIRQVDALAYDDGWSYNETWHLGSFTTTGEVSRAFRRALAHMGITFYRGRTATEYDGDVYEIVDRATRQPLFAAIPKA